MKKLLSALFVCVVFFATSCAERTCPTYTKAPVEKTTSTETDAVKS